MFNQPTAPAPSISQSLLFSLPPLAAFAIAAFPLAGWIIDDAGISFAYARNLAAGAGLVSQPGKPPVEGFSNPLWTLLFVPGFWLSAEVPVVLAKVLGHLFAFGTFVFGFRTVVRTTGSPLMGLLAMTFLALNTSFVVWAVSGLENALYAFEVAGLTYFGLLTLERLSPRIAVAAGLFAAAAALTRPEGFAFALIWPGAVVLLGLRDRRLPAGLARSCVAYLVAAALPFIAYKAIAYGYFGDLFPNTYYAKGAPGTESVWGLLSLERPFVLRSIDILAAPFGFAWLSVGAFFIAFALAAATKRLTAALLFLSGSAALAFLVFVLLPTDWMTEYRFGTPFLTLFYPALFSLIYFAGQSLPPMRLISQKFPAMFLVAFLAIFAILNHQLRFDRFYSEPTAPFSTIADLYGERFNKTAEILGIENGSFLLPDLGATLFYSNLEIYDLAGLTDATIARTLWTDKQSLRAYIFDEVKPTLILTYAYSALEADLDASATFRQDYVPIVEEVDAVASEAAGRTIYSGAYVRKDAVHGRGDALARARAYLSSTP